MKTVRNIILFAFIYTLSLSATENDSVLLRAEEYYRQNDFSQAIAEYLSLVESGWKSAELYYNLGNAYYKNHDVKSAILYYERARRLSPNDEAINDNLVLARSFIFDRVEAIPEHFLVSWGKYIRDLASVEGWTWWSIAAFLATLAFAFLFLFVHNITVRRLTFGLAAFCLTISLAAYGLGYLQKENIGRTDEAIVFVPSVTIKSSPDDSGNNLFIIHEGIKVRIEDRIGEWCEIRIPDGNKGWIRLSDIRVI